MVLYPPLIDATLTPTRAFATLPNVQSASTAQRIKQLKDEIKTIEEAIRKYRKIKHPGYPAQKAYEDRRIRLVEIQQEILALLKIR
jgi:vacuolar-type H+-ATPase subunit I/STV1